MGSSSHCISLAPRHGPRTARFASLITLGLVAWEPANAPTAIAQTYPPLPSPVVDASGANGADGSDQSGQGTDGASGGDGGAITGAVVGVARPAAITSVGGTGGTGGNGLGSVIGADGGRGGRGGTGGTLTIRLNTDAAASVITLRADGGDGGAGGGIGVRGNAGSPGDGGTGGTITFDSLPGSMVTSPSVTAALLRSRGGDGGAASFSKQTGNVNGANGGRGGDGGTITTGPAQIDGSIKSAGAGFEATSIGGTGGFGGDASSAVAEAAAGNGGAGGNGGSISLLFGAQANISATGAVAPYTGGELVPINGVTVRTSGLFPAVDGASSGGSGGEGGIARGGAVTIGGSGGNAGVGGQVVVTADGSAIATTGYAAPGIVGESIGGGGGSGSPATGGLFSKTGGSGGAGAAGGGVQLLSYGGGSIATTGDASSDMIAQSIGGGGGIGADVQLFSLIAGVALGGEGAAGGNSGNVGITNGFSKDSTGSVLTTAGTMSPGMLAQSVAGGGGVGGDAVATVVGAFALSIGGDGGSGGNAGGASVSNQGAIQTGGAHSSGMVAQSIGGGGGDGGWGSSVAAGAQYTAAVAVGGDGGSGGTGNSVEATNAGQVTTSGEDSYGIQVQSIGGGGGDGGDALSRVFQVYNDDRIPSILVNVGVGGIGGTGGNSGSVSAVNNGAVLTTGTQGFGLFAQSIGGGGGDGGDAETLNQSFKSASVSATVTVGGTSGAGGNGGPVTVSNNGAVLTLAKGGIGILAQSVGGGGGNGGASSADTGSITGPANNLSAQVTVAVGGSGNVAGAGGNVTVSSGGGILTRGDSAAGIYAQSIGGGGGNAGFGNALGSGGQLNVNVGVGGRGGGGGNGGNVTANAGGAILTSGGSAPAIIAQSIGGGGGNGGDAASGGGTDPVTTITDFVKSGLGIGLDTVDSGNGVLSLAPSAISALSTLSGLVEVESSYDTNNPQTMPPPKAGTAKVEMNVDVGGGFGGAGGEGGSAGTVNVSNTGALQSNGPASPGILAQSIGGGGGEGGAANPSAGETISAPSAVDLVLGVGGSGGSSGNGGTVTVASTGTIQTSGDLSYGIHAQSVGGGGGDGGATVAQNAVLGDLTISIGGAGGSSGNGGVVSVNLGGASTQTSIATSGRDASAVLAQSIGGGGGLDYLMGTNFVGEGGTGRSGTGLSNGSMIPDTSIVSLKIDGPGGASGFGGPVTVGMMNNTTVTTSGTDAYGIMAQSVGGGGGLVIGAKTSANTLANLYGGPASGAADGGRIIVQMGYATFINTSGAGGVGILAQSVGGGGGLIGGMSEVSLGQGTVNNPTPKSGQGGNILVSLMPGSNITTTGADAHGIFAQSVGGGGGVLALPNGQGFTYSSPNPYTACSACTGSVTVNVAGTINVSGAGAYGVYAESRGNGVNNTAVTVNSGGNIIANPGAAAAVFVAGAGTNTITNNAGGTIQGNGPGGVAIAGSQPATIINNGIITGGINLPDGTSTLNNGAGGMLIPGGTVVLGAGGSLQNSGVVSLIGAGANGTTALTGNFAQTAGGVLAVNLAAGSGQAGELLVDGAATLGGTVVVKSTGTAGLAPHVTRADIVSASGGVTTSGLTLATPGTPVVSLSLSQPNANNIELDQTVDYTATRAFSALRLASADRNAVGADINAIESQGPSSFDVVAAGLASIPSAPMLASTYDALSGETVVDAKQVAFAAHQAFSTSVLSRLGIGGVPVGGVSDPSAQMQADDGKLRVSLASFGGNDMLKGTEGAGSLNAQTAGAMLALEHDFAPGLTAGVAVGGGSANFGVSGLLSDGSQSSVQAGLFGVASSGPFYAKGVLSYGNYQTDETRNGLGAAIGLDTSARASFNSNVVGGRVELGWQHAQGRITMVPFAALEVDHLWQAGFSEAAGASPSQLGPDGLALRYAGSNQTAVVSTLGARVGTGIPLPGGHVLDASLELGWEHDFMPTATLDAAFLAAPGASFAVDGVGRSRDAAVTAMTGSLGLTRTITLTGSLSARFSSVETSYGGLLSARIAF